MRVIGITHALLAGLSSLHAAEAFVFRGVNLGAWLATEPWMLGILYNATKAPDEWHLCSMLGKDECKKTLENHWSTFITRDDFAEISNAGLNAVRIPLGHWAVDLASYEPYVQGQYPYLIRGVQWAKEFGLKVFIDLHGVPGSQNGWEQSGREGPKEFLANQTNQDRAVKVLKNLTEEFSKDEYGGTVTNIELMNEPTYGYADALDFYRRGADVVGLANQTSNPINITISDSFFNPHTWRNYDPWQTGASSPRANVTLDTHQFWAFPPLDKLSGPEIIDLVCNFSITELKADAKLGTPPVIVGEWSLSTGVTANSTKDAYFDVAKRTFFRELFEAQAAAYSPNAPGQAVIGWFFWAWKTQYDIDAWSYHKGLEQGYIPKNVSDQSTWEFPIRADGCIDRTHSYTAPVLATSTSTSTSPTATSNLDTGAKPSTSIKPSSATRLSLGYASRGWMAIATVMIAAFVLA